MLPGKKYKPEDFLKIAWNGKWLILIPTLLVTLATAAVSFYLPNRYRASTTIMIVPQRVPETYVRSTVTASIGERLQVISQEILSRTRLERIIQELNLYARDRETKIMEDVVEQMRGDIQMAIDNSRRRRDDSTSFSVSYDSSNPRTAMLVAERVASLFIQENLEDRGLLADATNQFLEAQLEDARRRLIEQEQRLQAFRQRNSGQLPNQVQSNLQLMQNTQQQIQANTDAANRDRDRQLFLERSLADAVERAAEIAAAPAPIVAPTPTITPDGQRRERDKDAPVTAAQALENARTELLALELRLKPQHPDVVRAKRLVAELEVKADAEALEQPLSAGADRVVPVRNGGERERAADGREAIRLSTMRNEIEEIKARLETRRQADARLHQLMDSYNSRVAVAPRLESEMTELTRDYATLQESYTTLLKKSEESKIAVNLERRQIGEQFKILDGARLPERPFSPDRLQINLMGLLGGLGFGLALVAFLEYRDTSLKTDDDVVTSLALPVLAVIPAMITAPERKRSARRWRLVAVSSSLFVLLTVAAVVVAWRMNLLASLVR